MKPTWRAKQHKKKILKKEGNHRQVHLSCLLAVTCQCSSPSSHQATQAKISRKKCFYGVDGERLKQIRFLLFFCFKIPYKQRHKYILRQSVDQRKKKTFSVIQFHFTWFSRLPCWFFEHHVDRFMFLLYTHTHTRSFAFVIFGAWEIEASPLLAGCKHKRRNIWFREGWDFWLSIPSIYSSFMGTESKIFLFLWPVELFPSFV